VNIKVGFSNVQILVPAGVSTEIFLDGRPGTISLNGAWLQGTDHFPEWTRVSQAHHHASNDCR
jgi:hypothetical protein